MAKKSCLKMCHIVDIPAIKETHNTDVLLGHNTQFPQRWEVCYAVASDFRKFQTGGPIDSSVNINMTAGA